MKKHYQITYQAELFYAIKDNDALVLKRFYNANYPKIEALVLKNNGNIDYAKDIYQESFIAVWSHVKNDTFIPQSETAFEGLLYQIAKNKWMDVLRSSQFKNTSLMQNDFAFESKLEDLHDEQQHEIVFEQKLTQTMNVFSNLGEPCKSLLQTFYFEKKSLRDIAETLQIEEATARNKKYRCMEKLRDMVITSKS